MINFRSPMLHSLSICYLILFVWGPFCPIYSQSHTHKPGFLTGLMQCYLSLSLAWGQLCEWDGGAEIVEKLVIKYWWTERPCFFPVANWVHAIEVKQLRPERNLKQTAQMASGKQERKTDCKLVLRSILGSRRPIISMWSLSCLYNTTIIRFIFASLNTLYSEICSPRLLL